MSTHDSDLRTGKVVRLDDHRTDGIRLTPLLRPLRATDPVPCETCGEEIEAFAIRTSLGVRAGYAWRHVVDGAEWCNPPARPVRPYDDFSAEREIRTSPAPEFDPNGGHIA